MRITKSKFGYALLIFSIGVSSHDVASIIGLHIAKFHALYWVIPLGIIGYILWQYSSIKSTLIKLIRKI